jgi:beta-phosphoglucomutase-like phosphatase (HAD superfamily)
VQAQVPVRAVVFDLDGVLIDSESVALRTLSALLRAEGVQRAPDDLRHLCGQRSEALRAYLVDCLGDPSRARAVA